jgi:transglutaminase-like putative cysteine protease
MQIRIGSQLTYRCPLPVPMLLMLRVHPSQSERLLAPDLLVSDPGLPTHTYIDTYGNRCLRLLAPAGVTRLRIDAVIEGGERRDVVAPGARQLPIEALPDDSLLFLVASRYCDTEALQAEAWRLFGQIAPGWQCVQAICGFVCGHIRFDYLRADPTRTASRTYQEREGVCRDFTHLAITLCRCMNIPARYCTGYLGDIGVPPVAAPMDFAAWMEVYLEGGWYTFDPRNHASMPRLGRVLIGRGRDAADVAIATTFGVAVLEDFQVWTDELPPAAATAVPR